MCIFFIFTICREKSKTSCIIIIILHDSIFHFVKKDELNILIIPNRTRPQKSTTVICNTNAKNTTKSFFSDDKVHYQNKVKLSDCQFCLLSSRQFTSCKYKYYDSSHVLLRLKLSTLVT